MDGLKWYRVVATWHKWTTPDRLLTIVIILAFVLLFLTALLVGSADAHGTNFRDIQGELCPCVAQGWVESVGFVFATDCDSDGTPDNFWRIYKAGDLVHVGLHIEPLTMDSAKKMLLLEMSR